MLITEKSINASVLYSNTSPVITGDEAVSLIIALEKEMETIGGCVGLAAPQIGISKSLAIIRHVGVSINLINPAVISTLDPFLHNGEGCKSFPGRRFNVPRFKHIAINNHNLWPLSSGAINVLDNPNMRPINRLNPPKGLFLVPAPATYIYDLAEGVGGGIICVAVQHEIEHLMGIPIVKKEGAVEVPSIEDPKWKVGRNDPCPCGSGRKFKKCCINKLNR